MVNYSHNLRNNDDFIQAYCDIKDIPKKLKFKEKIYAQKDKKYNKDYVEKILRNFPAIKQIYLPTKETDEQKQFWEMNNAKVYDKLELDIKELENFHNDFSSILRVIRKKG